MPAVEITDTKGLVQKTGSGVSLTSKLTVAAANCNVNHSNRIPSRYYLDEYFTQLPQLQTTLRGTKTHNLANLADQANEHFNVTVTGAVVGDFAMASFGSGTIVDLTVTAQVVSANTVTVSVLNESSGTVNVDDTTVTVLVFKNANPGNSHINQNFLVNGTNMTDALVTYDQDYPGAVLTTGGTDNDSAVIRPHLGTKQSQWSLAGAFDSQREVQWECVLTTGASIAGASIAAGLKLDTLDGGDDAFLTTTDSDAAYFLYSSVADAKTMAAVTTPANWHFVFSTGGADFVTDIGLAVAANTQYHLKVTIDSSLLVRIYVNGTQYGIASTAVAAGTTQPVATTASTAITTNKDLIPFAGIQVLAGAARHVRVHSMHINKKSGA